MPEQVAIAVLIKQFAAGELNLATLEPPFKASLVQNNLEAIRNDPLAAAALVQCFCASCECTKGEDNTEDYFCVDGRKYPIAAKLNDYDDYSTWAALPGIIRAFIDSPPRGQESDAYAARLIMPTLVKERFLTQFYTGSRDERSAWVDAGLWDDEQEAAANRVDCDEDEGGDTETEEEPAPV